MEDATCLSPAALAGARAGKQTDAQPIEAVRDSLKSADVTVLLVAQNKRIEPPAWKPESKRPTWAPCRERQPSSKQALTVQGSSTSARSNGAHTAPAGRPHWREEAAAADELPDQSASVQYQRHTNLMFDASQRGSSGIMAGGSSRGGAAPPPPMLVGEQDIAAPASSQVQQAAVASAVQSAPAGGATRQDELDADGLLAPLKGSADAGGTGSGERAAPEEAKRQDAAPAGAA